MFGWKFIYDCGNVSFLNGEKVRKKKEGIGTDSSGARGGVVYGVQQGIESTLSHPVLLYSSSGTQCTQYTTTPFALFESKGERHTLSVI